MTVGAIVARFPASGAPQHFGGIEAAETASLRMRTHEFVNNFRVAVLATIAFLAALMVMVAIVVAIYDVSDRAMTVIGVVLTALPTMVTGLIVYLKVDSIDIKADTAARRATVAAHRAQAVGEKLDQVHHDVLNGPMRDNVRQAVVEIEEDPDVQALRIATIAKGVSKDRHDKANREAAAQARAQMEDRVRQREQEQDG